jgi:topoisomerase-4 subunit A
VLRHSVDRTKDLIRQELEIRKNELLEQYHFQSLEKIFIEERIYKDKKFEQAPDVESVCEHIDERLTPYYPTFVREVTKDDILRLLEIKMQRILKFNKDKADELMARIKAEIEQIDRDLANLTEVTASWFQFLKDKYGKDHPRLTEIRNFDTIEASKVAEANQKLYINRTDGFIGTGLKKDEFVCNCSDLDDIIIFYKDGKYKVIRVAEKIFVGKNVLYLNVFKKNDSRTIYNVVYRDGKKGNCFIKRFNVTSMTRDKEYDLTQGTPGSKVMYFTANPNGEAEIIKVTLDPNPKLKKIFLD